MPHGRLIPVPRPHSTKAQYTAYPLSQDYSLISSSQVGSAGIQFRRLEVTTLTAWPYITAVGPAVVAKLVSNFLFPHQAKSGLTSKASPESHSESILWVWLLPSLHRCHSERHRPKSRMSSEKHEVKTVIKIDSRVTSSVVAGRVTRRSCAFPHIRQTFRPKPTGY